MDPQAVTDNVLKKKRKLTFVVIGFIFLLSGIEYAVILPTIWMYLQSLDAQPFFLGLVLSAFSLTELLAGPFFGYWSDRTGQTKFVILLSNCFEIAGNFLYFVGISKWLLLSSRLVAGIGAGAGASIFGYLTHTSSSQDRVPVFAMAMACRQAGLLIGPAFNVFLRYCNFNLGPFHVDKFSAPGIFMCALWTLIQLMVLFMFYDLPMKPPEAVAEETDPLLKQTENLSPGFSPSSYGSINTSNMPPIDHNEPTEFTSNPPSTTTVLNSHSASPLISTTPEHGKQDGNANNIQNFEGFLREEIVVLLGAQFVTFFNQTALETLVTPLAQTYLGFQDLQNSILYFLCGIELLIGFLAVRIISRHSSDRVLLVFGLIICIISCIWCLVFLAKPRGFNHGIRRAVGGIATILGPLWSAGLTEDLYIMLGVMMGLLILVTIMVILSYKYLVEPVNPGIQVTS